MKDKKDMWPPVLVKHFGPLLTRKGASLALVGGILVTALVVWINGAIRSF